LLHLHAAKELLSYILISARSRNAC